ncbi:MAG TPA: Rrf2 family transcriptional regulator [Rectinemataceae bacterium]|nr:Rrf2 family transcriptional regulator [Rectinemataceae bacterium]
MDICIQLSLIGGAAIFSTTGTYALRAFSILASAGEGRFLDARQLALAAEAPPTYLVKLLGQFVRAGLLEAKKGAGGGFRLARSAEDISLYEVLDLVEPQVRESDCILGRPNCNPRKACALHATWAGVRSHLIEFLQSTSVARLTGE